MRRLALAAVPVSLVALTAAASSAPSIGAVAPVNVIGMEPTATGGAFVVERQAAPNATGAETWRMSLDLMLENALNGSALMLQSVKISYASGGPSSKTVLIRQSIGARKTFELHVPEDRDHAFPIPASVTVELAFRGYEPKTLTRPLVEYRNAAPGGGYRFPGRREDLPDGWYWTDGQNHVRGTDHRNVAHQRFAYDFGVRRWDGKAWTNLVGTKSSENEDFLIFGLPLYAAASGTIVKCRRSFPENKPGTSGASGNGLWIQTRGSQELYFYAHMKRDTIPAKLCPKENDPISVPVEAGEYVGRVGNSGSSQGPHLHTEVYVVDANGDSQGRPMHFRGIRVRDVGEEWTGSPHCGDAPSGFATVSRAAVDRRMLVEPTWRPDNPEIARHGMSDLCFQDFFESAAASGYAPSWLSGFDAGGKTYLNVVFRRSSALSLTRFGLTRDGFQSEIEKAVAVGYRPTHVESYLRGGTPRYSFVAQRAAKRGTYRVYHGVTTAEHDRLTTELKAKGLVPTNVSVVAPGGRRDYTALWEERSIGKWTLRSAIPVSEYQKWLETEAAAGRKLVYVDAWVEGGKPMLSAIVSSKASATYQARHRLTGAEYQDEYERWYARKLRTQAVTAYSAGGQVRYAALWR
ncbi:MAG TPA: peptidoglycan DD-metalloendopeptidase family protein [Gaiellaceae bacterium]|nr:peptidoglycan DD-metalloendopeptidase family protein [Gaiellaceae bacterium]